MQMSFPLVNYLLFLSTNHYFLRETVVAVLCIILYNLCTGSAKPSTQKGEPSMQVDLTITISAILGASAVISPMLTAIINNKHQRKMKKMEYEHENEKDSLFYKRGIFEDYLKYTGQCIAYATEDGLQEYGKMYSLALIYFPDSLQEELITINSSIRAMKWDIANSQLNALAPKIRAILQNM